MEHKQRETKNFFYLVKLSYIHEIEVASFASDTLQTNDLVVAETRYGVDIVRVLGIITKRGKDSAKRHLGTIMRPISEEDYLDFEYNQNLESEYTKICKDRIAQRKLEMKIVTVHVLYNKSKVLIFFAAEQRVDFRDLVRDLVSQFHTRIELRQIGVRDETRSIGGIAMCGRAYCCHSINDQLKSATIKMVKDQELSLNSSKISGGCGRLLCCLTYEHDYYEAVRAELPDINSTVVLDKNRYRVVDIHTLAKEISLANYNDMAAKPLRMSSENLIYNNELKVWEFVKGAANALENESTLAEPSGTLPADKRRLVTTPCGCTRPEGTRCSGCSSKL
jgi:cell fate regulator YaaT (PSP1 superfamily)